MKTQPNVAQILAAAVCLAVGIVGAVICGVVFALAVVIGGAGLLMILGASDVYERVAR